MFEASITCFAVIVISPMLFVDPYMTVWVFGMDCFIWMLEKMMVALQFVGL